MIIGKKFAILFLALVFSIITFFVLTPVTLCVDTVLREAIYDLRSPVLTAFFKSVTFWGNGKTVAVLCLLVLLFFRKRLQIGIPLTICTIISATMQTALKIGFQRERPDLALRLVEVGGYSFPSGHSMTVLVFYGAALLLCRRQLKNRMVVKALSVFFPLLIGLIGLSRIYLGVHFPTDVLAGWSMGGCLLLILSTTPFLAQPQKTGETSA